MEELRVRDTDRRHQVEERKRQIWEAERDRREAILRKNQVNMVIFSHYIHFYFYSWAFKNKPLMNSILFVSYRKEKRESSRKGKMNGVR